MTDSAAPGGREAGGGGASDGLRCSPADFGGLAYEVLRRGNDVTCRVRGTSMLPSILDGEAVRVAPFAVDRVKRGDIVLCQEEERVWIHRVIDVDPGLPALLVTKGDNALATEVFAPAERIVGKVTAVRRDRRWISPDEGLPRLLGLAFAYAGWLLPLAAVPLAGVGRLLQGLGLFVSGWAGREGGEDAPDAEGPSPLERRPGEAMPVLFTVENHDDALEAWRRAGIRDRILVHLDAHLDFSWIETGEPARALEEARSLGELKESLARIVAWERLKGPGDRLTHIGNFLHPALKEGMLREVYWVIPEHPDAQVRKREDALVAEVFKRLQKENPGGAKPVAAVGNRIATELCGRPVTACRLADLPDLGESVLLDVDTDYLVVDSILRGDSTSAIGARHPWIWPQDLVRRIRDKGLASDLVTIAYSVEGGFTPLCFKYLGAELRDLLQGIPVDAASLEAMERRHQAAMLRRDGDSDAAIGRYEAAVRAAPEDAASHYNLALLYQETGLQDRARVSWRNAVGLDPSYKTAFNNYGVLHELAGDMDKAEAEFRRVLELDAGDGHAHRGLGGILARRGRDGPAKDEFLKALEADPDDSGARFGLGALFARQGLRDDAAAELGRAAALAPLDPEVHRELAAVFLAQGRRDDAMEEFRKAVQFGAADTPAILARLARLHLLKGELVKGGDCLRRAAALAPGRLVERARGWRLSWPFRARA